MRILIVDDDQSARGFIAKASASLGQCDEAANGEDAVDLFRQAQEAGTPYQLVFMDIMLPGMSGHEAVDAIREIEHQHYVTEYRQAAIVMITALDDSVSYERAIYGGASSYITKPFRLEEFREILQCLQLI